MTAKKALTLSIVIPVYNEQDQIKGCLDAIKNQTIAPQEVIVVDNNSNDKSIAIAKKYAFVRVITAKKQGIVFARNQGFKAAKCDIIGRIDADTQLPLDWVQRVMEFYSHPQNADVSLTGGGFFYNIRTPKLNGWLLSQLAYRLNWLISRHYILWGSNMAIPSKVWQSVAPDTCLRNDIHEDVDLAVHVIRRGYRIEYVDNIRVGVQLKRVWSDIRLQKSYSSKWPRTFRVHGYKLWWIGSLGNIFLLVFADPYIFISEGLARLFRRSRLPQ